MKKYILLLFISLLVLPLVTTAHTLHSKLGNTRSMACGACASNAGFELGNANGWAAQSGVIGNYTGGINFSINTPNNNPAQQTLVTNGNDEVGGFPRVCNLIVGNTSSVRLGNAQNGSGQENISYQFTVSTATPYFTYYYAVVLESAATLHTAPDQPRFSVRMTDGTNTPILCAGYEVNGSNAVNIGGFTNVGGALYKPWDAVIIPLQSYIGQCVTITFETRDCNFGDHYGYAYIDADCSNPVIKAPPTNCNNSKSKATLYAPPGAGSYTWTGPQIQGASNLDSVVIAGSGHWDCLMTTKTNNGSLPCTYTISTDVLPTSFTPTANFTYNTACQGENVNFNNTTSPANVWTDYTWDIGLDGVIDATSFDTSNVLFSNPTQQPISIPVKLQTKNSYCTADTVIYVVVNPKPVANAGVDVQVCNGSLVTLNSTTNALYEWYEGLNVFTTIAGNGQSYTTTPVASNNYTVIVTNQYGCKDTDDVYVAVNIAPLANFTATDVCYPNTTVFTNTTINTAAGDVYSWLFETGDSSSASSPNHLYHSCGTKPVKLVVKSVNGCTSVVLKNANVFCKPQAVIVSSNSCMYNPTLFFANNIGSSAIVGYNWDPNYPASTVQAATPLNTTTSNQGGNYLYSTDGIKNIVVVVTNGDGCKDTIIKSVTVYPVPTTVFNASSVCKNDSTTFTSTSTVNAPDNIVQYQWDYNNDGVYEKTSATNIQRYTYSFVYKGDAYLITTSNHGCKDTALAPVEVYPLPATNMEFNNVCYGTAVNFINTSTVGYGSIVASNWKYTFTDSALTIGTAPTSFTFAQPNYYTVLLTATSNYGCKNSRLKIVTVYPTPVVDFNALSVKDCAPFCVTQNNNTIINATIVPTTVTSYVWYFGTGDSSNAKTPLYCYASSNNNTSKLYTVMLKAESDYGCVSTAIKTNYIEVLPKPVAAFVATPTNAVLSTNLIELVDKSIYGNVITWDYGVPYLPLNTSAPAYQAISYNDSGNFVITQYVQNKFGCTDTAYQPILIIKDYNVFVPTAFTPNDDGLNDYFMPKSFGITTFNLLIFNRWGDVVAKINETTLKGWDGLDDRTYEKCKQDVYLWKLNYTTLRGNSGETNGRVTLVR